MDALFNPRHRRACTYKAVKPFLAKPIPAIKLKYLTKLTRPKRREAKRISKDICKQCGEKIAVLGATNIYTGEVWCDACAIKNYQVEEGFKTYEAAEAHRRRMFDVPYLLAEMLIDDYLARFELQDESELTDDEREMIHAYSNDVYNLIPKYQKIKMENEADQTKIEQALRNKIDYADRFFEAVAKNRAIDQFNI